MMTKEEIRATFTHINSGINYLNHASLGPLSQKVTGRLHQYLMERSESRIMNYETFLESDSSARKKLGRLFNTSPDNFAWVDNVSNAMNILANSINFQERDRILLNDIEFPANVYPFINLRQKGVSVDFVKSENGVVSAENIINNITEKTKLVSVSFVQFLSGYRTDVQKISDYCRSKGIIFAIDAIQGAGVIELDISSVRPHFLAGGTQKWLMGLQGLSYIYVDPEFLETMNPAYLGWFAVENMWDLLNYSTVPKTGAARLINGTLNVIGIAALDETLNLFNDYGIKNIERDVLKNTNYFRNLLEIKGFEVLTGKQSDEHLSGIVTFKIPDAKTVFGKLNANNIHCSLREGMLRFSPHFYNTEDEISAAVNYIESLKISG